MAEPKLTSKEVWRLRALIHDAYDQAGKDDANLEICTQLAGATIHLRDAYKELVVTEQERSDST